MARISITSITIDKHLLRLQLLQHRQRHQLQRLQHRQLPQLPQRRMHHRRPQHLQESKDLAKDPPERNAARLSKPSLLW